MATPRGDEEEISRKSPQLTNSMLPRKASGGGGLLTVPQTNTGGWDENSKALERTLEKELGKLTP